MFIRLILVLTMTFSMTFVHVQAKADNDDYIVTGFNGRDMSYYLQAWWHWFFSMEPGNHHPVIDKTGQSCDRNQSGPVWFLVGPTDSSEYIERRSCHVPAGKYIFLPLFQNGGWLRKGACRDALKKFAIDEDRIMKMEVFINSIPIIKPKQYRFNTPGCFRLRGKMPGASKLGEFPTYVDAYALLLKPLPVGKHRLRYIVQYNDDYNQDGQFEEHITDTSYELIIQ